MTTHRPPTTQNRTSYQSYQVPMTTMTMTAMAQREMDENSRMEQATSKLEGKIDTLGEKVEKLSVRIEGMDSRIMSRADIEAADNRRVLAETYSADQRAVGERLSRIEGSPARLLAWISVGIACLGVSLGGCGFLFTVATWAVTHVH